MKNSDIALIILIASVAVMIAFFVGRSLPFLQIDEQGTTVRMIDEIPAGLSTEPDTAVFNSEAVNPTVKTVIGKDD